MSPALREPGFRLTGWHVLAGVTGFFVIVTGLDIYFATLAYRTYSGEVASNPYEAGIAFNQTLEARRREAALGWRVEAQTDAGMLTLTVRDRDGEALNGLTVTGELTRPATTKDRRVLQFQARGEGRYAAPTGALTGAWDLAAVAANPVGDRLEIADRIAAP